MKKRRGILWLPLICMLVWMPVMKGSDCLAEEEPGLYARSAVLTDGESGRILYAREAELPLPMASTTKIMTCILALESVPGDSVCVVSGEAAAQPQVKLGMVKGDSFLLRDLLYSLMLESHNDTAVCIAESVAGSVEGFAKKMNQKAKELGCKDTYFVTPNGLDGADGGGEHHTTASDLARIMRYCIRISPQAEAFLEITGTMQYGFTNLSGNRSYSCVNHNAFLTMMEGALSGKTGFTGKAGYCYVGSLKRDGKLLIVALLGCGWPPNRSYKWSDTKKLMQYGLEQFRKRVITELDADLPQLPVKNGQSAAVPLAVRQEKVEILMRDDERVSWRLEIPKQILAPVAEGTQVGTLYYLLNGKRFLSAPVVAGGSVARRDAAWYFRVLIRELLLADGLL